MIRIFPQPQRSAWPGGHTQPDIEVLEVHDQTLRAQGYSLRIGQQRAMLNYSDNAGLRYGRDTLTQLSEDSGALPIGELDDWPDIKTRGFMLDISRDRVPTRDTLALLVKRLAAFRFNHLQLYMEHTFAYANHPLVWAKASPMTAQDMRWLDELCDQHGIELGANQNCFGHMERWLKHEHYRHRAETPDGFMQGSFKREPMSLAPTPENVDLALEITREVADTVTSPLINIGCDEVWELGKGVSAEPVAKRGLAAISLEHVARIAEPLLADGRTVQLWSDLLDKDPTGARPLAEAGAIATVWSYDSLEATSAFAPRVSKLAAAGYRTWVASGTGAWNSFGGRFSNAKANIIDAVKTAGDYDSEGVLLTEWGDGGHMQPPFASLPSLAFGGATAWCLASNETVSDDELALAVSQVLDDSTHNLARAMMLHGTVCDPADLREGNGTTAFYSWINVEVPKSGRVPSAKTIAAATLLIARSAELIKGAGPRCVDGELLNAEQAHVGALIAHGLSRAAHLAPSQSVAELRENQRQLWLERSREGGLQDSLAKMIEPA